jgi:DNA-binding NtrC family response regulator
MISKDSMIFIIEDDQPYGVLIQYHLKYLGFQNVLLFHDETQCLNNMDKCPEVLISDYHLNYMSGLKLIEEARKKTSGFYSILLSGEYDKARYSDDISLNKIDKYLIKGENELEKLSEVLNSLMNSKHHVQFY